MAKKRRKTNCASKWECRHCTVSKKGAQALRFFAFIALGVLVDVILGRSTFVGQILFLIGVTYFVCIPINNYYAKKKQRQAAAEHLDKQ